MKKLSLLAVLLAVLPPTAYPQLTQTFESGEDTSNWGNSVWTAGDFTTTFLSPSLGGLTAGKGQSPVQSFSRSFKDNTAGVDISSPYFLSMYVQLNTFDGPSSGEFEIIGGDFGSGNAGNLRATITGTPGVYKWQARDQNTGWQDLDVAMLLVTPYQVIIEVDPATHTYSATINQTDADGVILDSGSLSGLTFDQNVINNQQNGKLQFYILATAGGTAATVDNIRIQNGSVPEPTTAVLLTCGLAALLLRRNRRAV